MRRNLRPTWQRGLALVSLVSFGWSAVLAQPLYAQTHQPPEKHPGIRHLSPEEMQTMFGSRPGGGSTPHPTPVSSAPGSTYEWEGSMGGTNTGNGNKLTFLPLVGWTQQGGLP